MIFRPPLLRVQRGYYHGAEIKTCVEAGLTPLEALQAATLNAAVFLEATDSLGTIEVGKAADLVLLDANPLADIRNTQRIQAVILRGGALRRAGPALNDEPNVGGADALQGLLAWACRCRRG